MDYIDTSEEQLPRSDELPYLAPIAVRPDPISPGLWRLGAESLEQSALHYRERAEYYRRAGQPASARTYEREADRCWAQAQRYRRYL